MQRDADDEVAEFGQASPPSPQPARLLLSNVFVHLYLCISICVFAVAPSNFQIFFFKIYIGIIQNFIVQQCTLYNGLVNCNAKMSKCIERLVVIDFLDRVLKIRCQLTQYNHLVSNLLLFRIPLVTFAAVHLCTLGLSRNKCKVSPPEYFYF